MLESDLVLLKGFKTLLFGGVLRRFSGSNYFTVASMSLMDLALQGSPSSAYLHVRGGGKMSVMLKREN